MSGIVFILAVYFLPAIIASIRGHKSAGAIFALNLLLGWAILGWIGAFIWSLTGNTKDADRLASARLRKAIGDSNGILAPVRLTTRDRIQRRLG